MRDGLQVSYAVLEGIAGDLVRAAQEMASGGRGRPDGRLASASGIGDEIDEYLRSISLACGALADAAKTAAQVPSTLMRETAELDRHLASAPYEGFAVPEGRADARAE